METTSPAWSAAAPGKRQFTLRQLLAAMFALAVVSGVMWYSLPLGILLAFVGGCGTIISYRWMTVAEVLVSVAILGVIVALLLPTVRSAPGAARRMQCSNNLKQIALALLNYENTQGAFPPAYTIDAAGKPLLSWRVLILPYMEQEALYQQFHLDEPWDSPHNLQLAAQMPRTFACPAHAPSRTTYTTKYVAVVDEETMWPGESSLRLSSIADGAASTLMVVEWSEGNVPWTSPNDLNFATVAASWKAAPRDEKQAHHRGGVNVVFADGHIQFLSPHKLPMTILRALLTPAGKEKLPANWEASAR